MDPFSTLDNATGKITFPLGMYGSVDTQYARSLAKANSPLLLSYVIENDGTGPTGISVDSSLLLSLATRFETPVSARSFANLMGQFSCLLETLTSLNLPLVNVVYDINYMYTTSPGMHELKCIYLPVKSDTKKANSVKEFFAELPNVIETSDAEARDMMSAFATFIRNQERLNVGALTMFLKNLASAMIEEKAETDVAEPEEPRGTISLEQLSNLDISCEHNNVAPAGGDSPNTDVSDSREFPGTMVLDAIEFTKNSQTGTTDARVPTAEADELFQMPQVDSLRMASASPLEALHSSQNYCLVSIENSDVHQITGTQFTVGKSKRANYQIPHTTTVSRIHAYFACKDDGCWITDNKSLNGTFVNDVQLRPGASIQLNDGDKIVLSDKEFTFHIKEGE